MPVVLLFAVAALARTGSAAEKEMSGQQLYKAYCKTCHGPNSPSGEYTPMTLIQDQWTRFFEKKYAGTHAELADTHHDGKKISEVVTPEMLEKIRKFAVDHAADSEHPMTCGN
jgi:mono/diheme cytochrome c family protein